MVYIYEMYHHADAYPPRPLILEHKDPLARAHRYFNGRSENVDYIAAGNALRQALEKVLSDQLKDSNYHKDDGAPVTDYAMLGELTDHAIKLYGHMGFDTAELDELKNIFRDTLNQTSHFNPRSNLYRRELSRAFEIAEKLRHNKFKSVVEHDTEVELTVKFTDGTERKYTAIPADSIRVISENGSPYRLIETEQRAWEIKPTDADTPFYETKGFTLKELFDDTAQYYDNQQIADPTKPTVQRPADIAGVYSVGGKTLKDLVDSINTQT